jgi:DNA-binding MarR family transcriptional regulator
MTTRTRPAATTSPSTDGDGRSVVLDDLDEALVGIRRVQQRPGYRQRLLEGLPREVSLGGLRLLRVVQRASEPPTIGTVAEVLAIDPSTASRVVDRVVEDGLLERRACDRDRRRARLRVTEDGLELLAELTRRRRELLREITQDWEGDELDRLVGLLERLQDGFDRLERAR